MARSPAERESDLPRRPAADRSNGGKVADSRENGRTGNGAHPLAGGDISDLPARERRRGDLDETDPADTESSGQGDSTQSSSGKADAETDAPAKPKKRRKVLIVASIVVLAVAAAGVFYWLHSRDFATTDDAFVEGHVVAMSPQVSGRVAKVYVKDNQVVKAGDPLIDLDATDYEVALQQAKAAEVAARGKLAQAKAQVIAAQAGQRETETAEQMAEVNFSNVNADLKRYEALDPRARSNQQYENAQTAQKTAAMQVDQAKARQATAKAQTETADAAVATAEGEVGRAQADVRRAEVNLGYCHITAPADGRIARKSVEVGSYVTPSQALMAVVKPNVWVVANYKETQLENMRVGQAVTVSVDAFGGKDFTGHIDSFQAGTGSRFSLLPAENATGNFVKVVQRIPVKITLDNPDPGDGRFLAPGMSVEAKTRVRE